MRPETKRIYASVYERFVGWLSREGIPQEEAGEHVSRFVQSVGVGSATQRLYLSAIRHFLFHPHPRVSVSVDDWEETEDWKKLRNRALVLLVSETTLSLKRISSLNRSDFQGGYIRSVGVVRISDKARDAIAKYLSRCPFHTDSPDAPLFVSATGSRMRGDALRSAIVSALREQGVKNAGVWSLRPSFSPSEENRLTPNDFNLLLTTDRLSAAIRAAIALLINGVPLGVLARVGKEDVLVQGEEIWVAGHKIEHGKEQIMDWLSSGDGFLFGDKPTTKQMVSKTISNAVVVVTGKIVPPRLLYRQYNRREKLGRAKRPRPTNRLLAKIERWGVRANDEEIRQYFSVLTPRERYVIQRRREGMKLQDVGKELGISRQMVHMIENRAIGKLVLAMSGSPQPAQS